ncbi:hypothetical protein OG765_00200 [Streptomyces sp. NBC_00555]|uniref:hypothetical protein n=1 Tax=Streptomyces sp. NBC_00555 TaxID=2903662 RepID=UPI00225A60F7|nr:hypothetical protein [Streptomyces sp. NBC_00555]MCX5009438.1 hypothetical protein [Streptomyces sp. NBC_00555]
MDSATLLGLAGIGGTLAATAFTSAAAGRTARQAAERQERAQARNDRQAASAALASALVVCKDSLRRLMGHFFDGAERDPRAVAPRYVLNEVSQLRTAVGPQLQAVTDALGLVLLHDPQQVGRLGAEAERTLRTWSGQMDSCADSDEPSEAFLSSREEIEQNADQADRAVQAFIEAGHRAIAVPPQRRGLLRRSDGSAPAPVR